MARYCAPVLLIAGILALFAAPLGVEAQETELDRVDVLLEAGAYDEAREVLGGWWDGSGPADRRQLQRGLWLRALLTVDATMALRDYRRLAVEFPGGTWSDRALLRLGQAAFAADDLPEAAGFFRTLVRDYPSSPEALAARSWLDRWGAEANRRSRTSRSPSSTDPLGAALADEDGARSRPPSESRETARPFTVQLGAFSSVERAQGLVEEVRAAGFEARIVRIPGSSLVRVRSGRFGGEEATRDLMERLRARGFDAAMAEDAGAEEPLR